MHYKGMYGAACWVISLHGLASTWPLFCLKLFHDRSALLWLDFDDAALGILLKGVAGRGLVRINCGLRKHSTS